MTGSNYEKDFLYSLMAPSKGSLCPFSYLMTSSFEKNNFDSFRQEVFLGRVHTAYEMLLRMFEDSEDKESFLIEASIPAHEKRHFVDLTATTFGLYLFKHNWALCVSFFLLLQSLSKEGIKVSLPLREWCKSKNCPEEVKSFVHIYEYTEKRLSKEIGIGKPESMPKEYVPQQYDMILTKLEADNVTLPSVGFLGVDEYNIYPINGLVILEGIATIVQYNYISKINKELADKWWEKLSNNPQLWMYWSVPNILTKMVGLSNEQSLIVLEWALMIPADFTNNSPELDPAWRLYYIANYLARSKKSNQNIKKLIEEFLKLQKWRTTAEVVTLTENYITNCFSEMKIDANDPLSTVMHEYMLSFKRSLTVRKDNPLVGFDYLEKFDSLPPMTRTISPDGVVSIKMKKTDSEIDEIKNQGWLSYLIISRSIYDSISKKHISCPFSLEKKHSNFPHSNECNCNLDLKNCTVSQVMQLTGVQFNQF